MHISDPPHTTTRVLSGNICKKTAFDGRMVNNTSKVTIAKTGDDHMENQKIRIIKKNNDFSLEYQPGDIFTVDSTWYGGVNVTSKSGIPLSLDREEYELYQEEEEPRREIDRYSYHLGAMDSFCEMVAAGVKKLAMSHPCATKEERDLFLPEVKRICDSYGIRFYPEDEAFLTDLFPEELNRGTYNYLFYSVDEVLESYLDLKEEQKRLMENGTYTRQQSYETARKFGQLLSYTEEGTRRLIEKTEKQKAEGDTCHD